LVIRGADESLANSRRYFGWGRIQHRRWKTAATPAQRHAGEVSEGKTGAPNVRRVRFNAYATVSLRETRYETCTSRLRGGDKSPFGQPWVTAIRVGDWSTEKASPGPNPRCYRPLSFTRPYRRNPDPQGAEYPPLLTTLKLRQITTSNTSVYGEKEWAGSQYKNADYQ